MPAGRGPRESRAGRVISRLRQAVGEGADGGPHLGPALHPERHLGGGERSGVPGGVVGASSEETGSLVGRLEAAQRPGDAAGRHRPGRGVPSGACPRTLGKGAGVPAAHRRPARAMTEICDQDLSGASVERVSFRGATFTKVSLSDATMRQVDFTGTTIRGALFSRSRLLGVELVDVEISGEVGNVVVNGVDIAPLIEAELDRRMPDRARMRPDHSAGFRQGWAILERLWEGTVARARELPEETLHQRVDGEWSFIETLRHLNFASASWVDRMILGQPSPWHRLDLPWDEAPGWAGVPWDRQARPSLDEVLAVRGERQATVRRVLAALTDHQLASRVSRTEPGWPQMEGCPVKDCLRIVLNEEWQHRLYAERDLTALGHDD